jgi:hypothetical protein
MPGTKATDHTDVGQGLAVGCLALGVTAVTSGSQALEFAFGRAWRGWPRARDFRFVHADIARNDIVLILRRSARRRPPLLAAWELKRWATPYLFEGTTLADAEELLPEWTGVPWSSWLELAEAFTAEFKDDEMRRARLSDD